MSAEQRVFSLRGDRPGPVHWMNAPPSYQAWCGTRPQFRHHVRPGAAEEVTCKTCLRRMALGRPLARGARR